MRISNMYRKSTAIGTYRYIHAHNLYAGVRGHGGKKIAPGTPYDPFNKVIRRHERTKAEAAARNAARKSA